mmetsp:Transcript_26729/g.4765  ORF Transcript_26729/g.4765 Transcript_26729/m.4765 type:complete len:126 (+) Transcript_26729:1627-2004(+)
MPVEVREAGKFRQTYEMSQVFDDKEEDGATFQDFENAADKNFNIAKDRVRGMLFFTHFMALLKKRAIYSMRDYKGLAMEVFLPIIVILFGLILLSVGVNLNEKSLKLEVDNYSTPQKVIWNYDHT